MTKMAYVISLVLIFVAVASASNDHSTEGWLEWQKEGFHIGKKDFLIHTYEYGNLEETEADVLFYHGFADCDKNHDDLFEEFRVKGIRSIAFDFPGHGQSDGSINQVDIEDLASIASQVYQNLVGDERRDLYLAGWSTGGLVAVREMQKFHKLGKKISGAVLFAPGVSVRTVVGSWGFVTLDTLSVKSTPDPVCPIKPNTPLKAPLFAASLLAQSVKSEWSDNYPENVPTLVFVVKDGAEDKYCKTSGIKDFVLDNNKDGTNIIGYECDNTKHWIDRDLPNTAKTAAAFLKNGSIQTPRQCELFTN